MEYLVTLPNSIVLTVSADSKGKGQECMDQVCQKLGIVEQDYFGLMYKGRNGENLWLNLRNILDRQLFGPLPYRLQFRVKFFVPPHKLIQPSTRRQFYEQTKAELTAQKLVCESEEQLKYVVALIAQTENGNFDRKTHQLNLYKTLMTGIAEPTPEAIHGIVEAHMQLVGMSPESAQYKLIQEATTMPNYGFEYHEAVYNGENIQVGIGPTGVFLYNTNMELIEKLEYPTVARADQMGKTCILRVMNDNGIERDINLRMFTQSAGNAVYRIVTEMHSFFCCDTVHSKVSSQFSRDLKGTLASLFNEKTRLGCDFIFDIKRTSREAYDHARRLLHQPVPVLGSTTQETVISDTDTLDCDSEVLSTTEKCQVLEDTLEKIEDSFTCCVCRDAEISAALCPCGHLTCYDCAKRLVECPLCRNQIKTVQRIYLPSIQCKEATCTSISLQSVTKSPGHTHCQKSKKRRMESPETVRIADS